MSSAYVEYHVDDLSLKAFNKGECQWSNTNDTYVAISVFSSEAGGSIKLVNKNGLVIDPEDQSLASQIPIKPGARVCSYSWHPVTNTLAVGWENGDLGCYQIGPVRNKWVYSQADEEYSTLGPLMHIHWLGSNGNELVTIDASGLLIIWTFDQISAVLSSRASHQVNDEITDAVPATIDGDPGLYMSSAGGLIYQLQSSQASVTDVVQLEQSIKRLMFFCNRSRLIVITENFVLYQYAITDAENFTEVAKVKLSGANRILGSETISLKLIDESQGLIGICVTGERVVRLWQLETGQNAAVIVAESADSHWAGVTTLDYNCNVLAAGTSNSHVIIWRRSAGLEFHRISQVTLKGAIRSITVNKAGQVALTTASNEVYLLQEQSMCSTAGGQIVATQTGAKAIKFFWMNEDHTFELEVDLPIRMIYIDKLGKCVAINLTGAKDTEFYKIGQSSVVKFKSHRFECSSDRLFQINKFIIYYFNIDMRDTVSELSIITLDLQNDNQTSEPIMFDGKVQSVAELKLNVTLVDMNGNCLLAIFECSEGRKYYYIVCEVKGQDFKTKCPLTSLSLINGDTVRNARVNCTGDLIAICDGYRIFVLKIGESEPIDIHSSSIEVKETDDVQWATNEHRLFAYQDGIIVNIMMCSQVDDAQINVRQYDQIELQQSNNSVRLLTFEVPDLYFLNSADFGSISKETLNEFKGLSLPTIKIMIDFLTTPSLDLNQMIKTINRMGEDNVKLWTNLARISVKCRDIKMGLYCITKLKNARVAADVKRELKATNDEKCGLAILAINLQLFPEAEELLKQSSNKLALSRYYQSRNEWEKAIECVDKVNLKTVYYNYAKHLENEEGNVQEAIKFYEKSNTHVFEVPRMLFDIDGNAMLQRYCLGSSSSTSSKQKDPQLIRWWGQYCESLGDISQALAAYEKANDYYHLVRLLCYTGETEKAKAVLLSFTNTTAESDEGPSQRNDQMKNGSKDAALLHLGRHLEASNPNESIGYYLSCGAIKHALRVCRNNSLVNDLIKITVNYGTKDDAKDLLNSKFFTDPDEEVDVSREAIVQLYHKCGQPSKAIEYAIRYHLWSQLRDILRQEMNSVSADSQENQDRRGSAAPVTEQNLELALEALREDADMIDIVIDMLLLANSERLSLLENLLTEYNVEINERLIDKVERVTMKSRASSGGGSNIAAGNNKLAYALAEMALQQGKHVIAAKLFNSLGDRTGSIKALIRSGQTDKVISYANIARDKNVMKLAANYLQTVNHEDANLIATFYRKAGAKQELERFMKKESL